MNKCIGCELKQARFLATSQVADGWEPERVCRFLSNRFGENYYTKDGAIWRKRKTPDFKPYLIIKFAI